MKTRIKICGITCLEDAMAACDYGADAVGFVFADSPRQIAPYDAVAIARALPPFVRTVGIFTAESPTVTAIADLVGLDLIQLHGDQSDAFAGKIGPHRVVRAIRVKDENSIEYASRFSHVKAFLLDAWHPEKKGGSGLQFDWDLAAKAFSFNKPVILAGGLTPDNVADAIRTVKPYAVDVSSGVEVSPGKKDHNKIKEFIDNVRAADAITR